ncbi:MAG: deoxyguanosinetriphosphate triphosphohydrolase, partial [Lachnospiraceae bacterium]|nr:deoxyguanosinetriphosphate triphosphohydrolase [Lachnospiraceae bacterium]
VHCKSFRRLKDKTQGFLSPDGDHYRTRLTHTLEVSQIARTMAKALRLNEDLTEAIALAHDLGHTPFGHAGERALDRICPMGFRHNEQSVRVVECLEKDGRGLNLTYEVMDGVLNHEMDLMPATLEGRCVRLADKIAYTYHDMDDAVRSGILSDNVPEKISRELGDNAKARLNTLVHDVITYSDGTDDVKLSPEAENSLKELRSFMFEKVYTNPRAKSEEGKAEKLVETLYDYYLSHWDKLPSYLLEKRDKGEKTERLVCDYIGSMTDRYAINRYSELFVPRIWHG